MRKVIVALAASAAAYLCGCSQGKMTAMFSPQSICTSDDSANTIAGIMYDNAVDLTGQNDVVKNNAAFSIQDATLEHVDRADNKISCSIILKETLNRNFVMKSKLPKSEYLSNRIEFDAQPTVDGNKFLYTIRSDYQSNGEIFLPMLYLALISEDNDKNALAELRRRQASYSSESESSIESVSSSDSSTSDQP